MVKYIDNYVLYEEIGSGVYGKVYRSVNNTDKKEYAIKVIPISKFKENKKLQECTVNEINILSNMEPHQHIIRYFDMLKTNNNFYFIYQYCNGGTLDNLIQKEGKLTENKALIIFKQLLQAFQFLNKYNIMHRDMKPDNIFFHNGIVKLGDFGFCKNLNSADQMAKTMLGSPIYMAPEVIKGEIYSNKSDIWSLGVVLYQMLFGQCPFQSNSIAKLIQVLNTKQIQFPFQISPYLKNLITRMLSKDPNQRISWMQLFQIKISSQGYISTPLISKITSLQQAKISTEDSSVNSSKNIYLKEQNRQISKEQLKPNANFKKIKSPQFIQAIEKKGSSGNIHVQLPKQQKLITQQHLNIINGIKLSLQVVQLKIPNSMGCGYLILSKVIKMLEDLIKNTKKQQIVKILQSQLKEVKKQQQNIKEKMFAYQFKGLEDWKKYLRGKFFEEQKTISIWYKMVAYLNGSLTIQNNLKYKQMVESVKNILY